MGASILSDGVGEPFSVRPFSVDSPIIFLVRPAADDDLICRNA